jgi:hypothetical protein
MKKYYVKKQYVDRYHREWIVVTEVPATRIETIAVCHSEADAEYIAAMYNDRSEPK